MVIAQLEVDTLLSLVMDTVSFENALAEMLTGKGKKTLSSEGLSFLFMSVRNNWITGLELRDSVVLGKSYTDRI